MVPHSTRSAGLANPARAAYPPLLHQMTVAAGVLGLHLYPVELRHAEEVDSAFATMNRAGADALIVPPTLLLLADEVVK